MAANRLGHALPVQLAELLTVCNGASIGPGGLFGLRPDRFLWVEDEGMATRGR